jgi:hypothetical protein
MPQDSSQDRRHVLQLNWPVVAIRRITTEYELGASVNGGRHANDTMSDRDKKELN